MPLSTLIRCDALLRPPPVRRSISLKLCWPVCRNLIPWLITGLQRQWTRGATEPLFMWLQRPPGKRHGSPPTERRPGVTSTPPVRGAVLRHYITANQPLLWAPWLCVAGTPERLIHITATAGTCYDRYGPGLWWSMLGLYATSPPSISHSFPIPFHPGAETEGGLRHRPKYGGSW